MQPTTTHRRLGRGLLRLGIAGLITLAVSAAPSATVHACSCARLGGPMEMFRQAIASSDVAFIGTVVDIAPAPPDPQGIGPVRYAFAVEAASAPVEETIEVRAFDESASSCGLTFGRDETWFVVAHAMDGALQTELCSGNTPIGTLAEAEREQLAALLNVEPMPSTDPTPLEANWLPVVGIVLALLAVGGVTLFAFRRDGIR
jgi:hypothetical protein